MTKDEMRKKYLALRDAISPQEREECGRLMLKNLTGFEEYRRSETLLVYVSVSSEAGTYGIIERALADGKTVAVPRVSGSNMSFRRVEDTNRLFPGEFGIPTSDGEEITDFGACLCITPAITVDTGLNRLGYGAGYYDRFLAGNPQIKTAALCFEKLLSDLIPAEKHDIKMDFAITEKRLIGGAADAGE